MSEKLEEYFLQKERKERLEHRDVLLAIASILTTDDGQKLFKYLFKNLNVGELPPLEMSGKELYDYLGFLRAGNSIYKLACEADSEIAASLVSKLEREKYDDLCEQHRLEHDVPTTD